MSVLNTKVIRAHFGAVNTQYPNLFTRILVQKIVYNIWGICIIAWQPREKNEDM